MNARVKNPNCSTIALIRHPEIQPARWLACRNPQTDQWEFIEAMRIANESYRETIDREIAWRLHLARGSDYLVSSVPRLRWEQAGNSAEENKTNALSIEFYLVILFGSHSLLQIDGNKDNSWLMRDEIFTTVPGRNIQFNERQKNLLLAADLLAPADEEL